MSLAFFERFCLRPIYVFTQELAVQCIQLSRVRGHGRARDKLERAAYSTLTALADVSLALEYANYGTARRWYTRFAAALERTSTQLDALGAAGGITWLELTVGKIMLALAREAMAEELAAQPDSVREPGTPAPERQRTSRQRQN